MNRCIHILSRSGCLCRNSCLSSFSCSRACACACVCVYIYIYICIHIYIYIPCNAGEWVLSHTWMHRVVHMRESYHSYEWATSHMWMSHITHVNESCRSYDCVMSHIWRNYFIHKNEPYQNGGRKQGHIIEVYFERITFEIRWGLFKTRRARFRQIWLFLIDYIQEWRLGREAHEWCFYSLFFWKYMRVFSACAGLFLDWIELFLIDHTKMEIGTRGPWLRYISKGSSGSTRQLIPSSSFCLM